VTVEDWSLLAYARIPGCVVRLGTSHRIQNQQLPQGDRKLTSLGTFTILWEWSLKEEMTAPPVREVVIPVETTEQPGSDWAGLCPTPQWLIREIDSFGKCIETRKPGA